MKKYFTAVHEGTINTPIPNLDIVEGIVYYVHEKYDFIILAFFENKFYLRHFYCSVCKKWYSLLFIQFNRKYKKAHCF